MYIQAASCISAQQSFRSDTFEAVAVSAAAGRISLLEPDYSKLIDPKLIRRMSKIIRMGVATAMDALEQAAVAVPDAILMGTAYGCLEDTGVFLKKMVENQEEMLTPTAFIQSTHNTVAAQIALMLKCHGYNNTYVQGAISFASALLDARLTISEWPDHQVLVGAADELTAYSYPILRRFGLFKQLPAGEGAGFFLLSNEKRNGSLARLAAVHCFHADAAAVQEAKTSWGREPDLVLGAAATPLLCKSKPYFSYSSLAGEFPTAGAFGFWLACKLLAGKKIQLPGIGELKNIQTIWLHQADMAGNHALIVLESC